MSSIHQPCRSGSDLYSYSQQLGSIPDRLAFGYLRDLRHVRTRKSLDTNDEQIQNHDMVPLLVAPLVLPGPYVNLIIAVLLICFLRMSLIAHLYICRPVFQCNDLNLVTSRRLSGSSSHCSISCPMRSTGRGSQEFNSLSQYIHLIVQSSPT